MGVVDELEVVHVGDQHGQRLAPAPGPVHREVGLALPGARVQYPGLRVGARLRLELRVQQAALEQDDRRQRDDQEQGAERAADRDQDANAGLGQVEQHPLAVPEHVGQPGVRVDEPGGDRDQDRVQHAERDGAGDRNRRLLRAHQPRVRARVGQPDRRLALGNDRGEQPEQDGGARAGQPEGRRAEQPAGRPSPAAPGGSRAGRGRPARPARTAAAGAARRAATRPESRSRQTPMGCPSRRVASTQTAPQHISAPNSVTSPRVTGVRARLPGDERQVRGQHTGDVADQRERLFEQRGVPRPRKGRRGPPAAAVWPRPGLLTCPLPVAFLRLPDRRPRTSDPKPAGAQHLASHSR